MNPLAPVRSIVLPRSCSSHESDGVFACSVICTVRHPQGDDLRDHLLYFRRPMTFGQVAHRLRPYLHSFG